MSPIMFRICTLAIKEMTLPLILTANCWQGLFPVVKGNMWKHGYYSIKMNSLRTGIS